jgi:hypothetical protein
MRDPGKAQSYRAAATTGCEGVGGATLAVGAFLRGVRGGFRLQMCRSRDFHSSVVVDGRSRGGGLAYDARRRMWGDRHARPSPGSCRRRAVLGQLEADKRHEKQRSTEYE